MSYTHLILHPMRKIIPTHHPLSTSISSGVFLYTNATQSGIMQDSLLLAKHSAEQLQQGEHVLYINTLAQHKLVEQCAEKINQRSKGKITVFSATSSEMMQKLDFLRHTISAKKVKLVILNSFEFAALHSRQKVRLIEWIRSVRDGLDCRVVVYSMQELYEPVGAIKQLRWLAERSEECGDWRSPKDITRNIKQHSSNTIAGMFDKWLDTNEAYPDKAPAPEQMSETRICELWS
jgi:hypothetical protein